MFSRVSAYWKRSWKEKRQTKRGKLAPNVFRQHFHSTSLPNPSEVLLSLITNGTFVSCSPSPADLKKESLGHDRKQFIIALHFTLTCYHSLCTRRYRTVNLWGKLSWGNKKLTTTVHYIIILHFGVKRKLRRRLKQIVKWQAALNYAENWRASKKLINFHNSLFLDRDKWIGPLFEVSIVALFVFLRTKRFSSNY